MRAVHPRRRGITTGIAVTALLVGTASGAFAEDADVPPVTCSVDDDVALLGEEIFCDASGLEPDKEFNWALEYVALDFDIGFYGDRLGVDEGTERADVDGDGTFSFVVPENLPIGYVAVFEGVVFQGAEDEEGADYKEYFGGVIVGDFEPSDLLCSPEPAIVGTRVTCESEDYAGAGFDWFAGLLDVDAPDIEAPFAEGEGTVSDDGTLSYGFDLPADTTAGAYLTVVFSHSGFGMYVGEIGETAKDSNGDGAPVAAPVEKDPDTAPVEKDPDTAPVAVERPTRVDTGAGGTAEGAAGAAGAAGGLLAVGLVAALGLGLTRRRSTM